MSNAKTGIFSALGALVGGLAGAAAGRYAAESRPRHRYSYNEDRPGRRTPAGTEIEDAMVVGAGAGAVMGAFLGGAIAGEPEPAQTTPSPQLPR